jgi:hypothetical protein
MGDGAIISRVRKLFKGKIQLKEKLKITLDKPF